MEEQRILTVSAVNGYIKELLDEDLLLRGLLVRGEVSNYKLYPSGHHYFTLKDSEGALKCVMFRGNASYGLKFRPENGMKVIAEGRISIFPRDGAYQLYCTALHADGIGDLHVAFEQLKEKLYREGLFDPSHKKTLPPYPTKIAIVTSSAGAAVHDMIRVIRRRYPLVKLLLLPVRVQGVEAPPEIVGAIRYVNRHKLSDLIITGRGGGSMEDLWAFNDERVARAIYDSEIPVISAVGHEPDVTIADFVADVRAATPSHAGEISVPDQEELYAYLRTMEQKLVKEETQRLRQLRERLTALQERRVLTDPMAYIEDKRMLLSYLEQRLFHSGERMLTKPRERLTGLVSSLDALSPLKVISRGYAMVTGEEGQVIKSTKDMEIGDTIRVSMKDGSATCTVTAKRRTYGKRKNL